MAFEEAGFCVVRGPDLLWGGDIRLLNPPAGKFDRVIGGPPCQAWSQLRFIVAANGFNVAPDLIPEFERCVAEARPSWFLMENVPAAPEPKIDGYIVRSEMLRDLWVGGATERLRRFSFGTERGARLPISTLALHQIDGEPAVTCDLRRRPVRLGGSRKPKESGGKIFAQPPGGAETLERMLDLSGLSDDFFGPECPLTQTGRKRVIGNGVPLPMGRAVARAVLAPIETETEVAKAGVAKVAKTSECAIKLLK